MPYLKRQNTTKREKVKTAVTKPSSVTDRGCPVYGEPQPMDLLVIKHNVRKTNSRMMKLKSMKRDITAPHRLQADENGK